MVKKSIDLSGETEEQSVKRKSLPKDVRAHARGIAGDVLTEPVPRFNKSKNETVYEGGNNTFIVLGRDRPRSRMSGYGGLGDTQAGAIDIVAGRMGSEVKAGVWADNDFIKDAARINISQKTNIDDNFLLASGKVGNSVAKSGIGIKADAVRIIAREGIKLVTGTDGFNSQGGTVDSIGGIELNAGNNSNVDWLEFDPQKGTVVHSNDSVGGIQPMVKGGNAAEAMSSTLNRINQLSGLLSAFLQAQMEFNTTMGTHFHNSPFYGIPTTPSAIAGQAATKASLNMTNDCINGLMKFKANMQKTLHTYLRPYGTKYINSRFNSLN